ncbi:MAG: zinc protease [Gemmatales bacterium]|nr:MAG: zinc protease [Gemmatales bacterium]
MPAQQIFQHTFANGLTLLADRMTDVRSAAMNFLIPAGCVYDPPDQLGLATVLADLITRGAGTRDSRQLSLALDNLGFDRDESVGALHIRFWGATTARNLPKALEIYADIIRRPHLPEQELPAVKSLALQDIQSLEDEPRLRVMIELRKRFYSIPLGRDHRGTKEGIENLTIDSIRSWYEQRFRPKNSILAVAGNMEWEPLCDLVGRLFGDWQGEADTQLELTRQLPSTFHLQKDTTQTQIGIAYPSVPIGHDDYYAALGAVNVLSGGMSSRLFTEVREKRALCYAVGASYHSFKHEAGVICYAGTTNERAQETLDVTLHELRRLQEGVAEEEVERIRAGLKSSLILQQESTSARAAALCHDWYYLGRIRTFDEIAEAINGLSAEKIVDFVRRYPPGPFTIVTLGPKALRVPTPEVG